LQVLFAKFFGGARLVTPHPPKLDEMLRAHDAALLIGDAALQVPLDAGYHLYDLAHVWHRATGKPFVFAFWAVRLDALNQQPAGMNLARVFQQSRDHGLEPGNLDVIAREWSPKLGLSEDDIRSYLTENIHYYLDRENHAGLKLFLQYSQEIGLIPAVPDLRFLGPVAFGSPRK
jgi:chorismate dehydratase